MDSRQELLAQLKQPPTHPQVVAAPEPVLRCRDQRNNETVSAGVVIDFGRFALLPIHYMHRAGAISEK